MHVLEEITVLDMTRRYPGAYSTMYLGDFGAEVIKIDPPPEKFSLPGVDASTPEFAANYAPDRNKKSIVIDLASDGGQEIFSRLVKKADVLVEGFRPGVMKRLKADYETLIEENPRLIYCSLTGFGHDGPYARMPGHDMSYCALAGALSMIGQRNGPPYLASNYLADVAGAGLHGVIGILLALIAREKTGRGQFVDIAFLDGVISLLVTDASLYFATGKVPRRGETPTTGAMPWANIYRCKDGEYISVGCIEIHFWENLCRAVGREDLIPHHSPPPEERDKVISEIGKVFLTQTRDEWFEFLKDKETCVGPVYYLNETFSDPQVLHRRMVVEVDHPELGKIKQTGIPIKLSETPGQIRSLGTLLGAHTNEILHDLDYDQEAIEDLRRSGAVR